MRVLIIIPAYNESENICSVVRNLEENFPQYDYVVINDCSRDNTEEILKENNFNYISLPINLGIGGGVQCGYLYAVKNGYDITVQYDGDGQHNAEYIKDIIRPIEEGKADMVIGSRFITKEGFQTSSMRRLGINIIRFVIKLCSGVTVTDTTSGFRACSKEMTRFFSENYAQDYPEPEAIVSAALNGFRVKEEAVVMNERAGGVSSISGFKSAYYMIKVSLAIILHRFSYIGHRLKRRQKK
ncbi:MAG: glycosyltransferase family 2 protein [Oscillospiraceae bacterium]